MINLKDLHFDDFELPGLNKTLYTHKYSSNGTLMCFCKVSTINLCNQEVYCVELTINKLNESGKVINSMNQHAFFNDNFQPVMTEGGTNTKYSKSYISDRYIKFVKESLTLYKELRRFNPSVYH